MPLCGAAARSCWPARVVSAPGRLPPRSAATTRPSAPHQTPQAVFTPTRREPLQALLHQSPRTFGKPTSLWTLDLATAVDYATGLLPRRVSGDTIRNALARLNTRWQ